MPPFEPTPVLIAKKELISKCVGDGLRIGLSLSYVEGASKQLSSTLEAVWCAPRRMWVLDAEPPSRVASGLHYVYQEHADVFAMEDVEDAVKKGLAQIEPDYFTQMLDVQVFPLTSGGMAVSFQYDRPTIKAMRALQGRFHKFAQAWEVRRPVGDILRALRDIAGISQDFVFVHERPVVLEDLVGAPKSQAPITVPAATPPRGDGLSGEEEGGTGFLSTMVEPMAMLDVDEDLLQRISIEAGLRDYQTVGVRFMLARTGCLNGDDMGMGKSRQAVVAGRLSAGFAPDDRVLVVCPASLRINWEREIKAVFPNAIVGMVGEDRMATLYGCQWVITNYEKLGGLVRETGLGFKTIVVDEAHNLKEHEAGRTRNAFIIAERIPRKFIITGTPLLNREIELHTLLRLTGHPLGMMPLTDFRKQYSGGKDKRSLLASELSHWMIRRRKNLLKDLGIKTKQVRYISPAEGLGTYRSILDDMSLMVMPKIVKLRQTLEALKFDFVVETIQSLGEDDKIIIFTEYMATVEALKRTLSACGIGCVSLVGSDSPTKRQKAIDVFQADSTARVFIGTTLAAGVGITLTAANYVLFCSLPWTPALMRQAEDRAYRLGQKRDVIVLAPIIPGTIDEQIWALLEAKTELEQDVVEAAVMACLPA